MWKWGAHGKSRLLSVTAGMPAVLRLFVARKLLSIYTLVNHWTHWLLLNCVTETKCSCWPSNVRIVFVHCCVAKIWQLKSLVIPYNTHCVSNYIWIVRCLYFWCPPLRLPLLLFEQDHPPDFISHEVAIPISWSPQCSWWGLVLAKKCPMHVVIDFA